MQQDARNQISKRDLIERIAGVVGLTLFWSRHKGLPEKCFVRNGGEQKPWDPVENDGDAMRLAVDMTVKYGVRFSAAMAAQFATEMDRAELDCYAVARWAIALATANMDGQV